MKKEKKVKKEIILWDPNWLKSITNLINKTTTSLLKKIKDNNVKLKLPDIDNRIPPPSKPDFDNIPSTERTASYYDEMTDERFIKQMTGQDSSYLSSEAKEAFKRIMHEQKYGSTKKQPNPQPYTAPKKKSTSIQSYTKDGKIFLRKKDIIKFIRSEADSFENQILTSSNRTLGKTGQIIGKVLRTIALNIEKGESSPHKEE